MSNPQKNYFNQRAPMIGQLENNLNNNNHSSSGTKWSNDDH